jgi:hypothetical protein
MPGTVLRGGGEACEECGKKKNALQAGSPDRSMVLIRHYGADAQGSKLRQKAHLRG